MGGFDYPNARVRGMRGRLLPEELLSQTLAAPDLPSWSLLLQGSPYAPHLGAASPGKETATSLDAVDEAVAARSAHLANLAEGKAALAIRALLGEWDLANLVAASLAVTRAAPAADAMATTLAGGLLDRQQISELVKSSSLREMADRLLLWGSPWHLPFRQALGRKERAFPIFRLALARSFHALLLGMGEESGDEKVGEYLAARVDVLNIGTALLWQTLPSDRQLGEFFLPGGRHLPRKAFLAVMGASDIGAAIAAVPHPRLRRALAAALPAYERGSRVSALTQAMDRSVFREFTRTLAVEPLSGGVPLSFLLRLRREGILLKLGLSRLRMGIAPAAFLEVVGDV